MYALTVKQCVEASCAALALKGVHTMPIAVSAPLSVRVSWGQRLVASPLRQGEILDDHQ